MALRSVLSIDVNDSQFKAFAALHEKYMAALKKAPAAWAQVEKNIDASRESFDKLVGQMAAAKLETERREKAQQHLDDLTRSSAERWSAMARSTKDFARNIGEATTSLLRWASVTGVISGLIGAGGLFGIDRLALGAASQRRGALGLGANIGEQQAFSANFSRLVDPDSFVGGVARARLDVNQRTGLIAAGLTPGQISGTAGQTSIALLTRLKELADKWDPRLFAQYIEAYRLQGIVSPEDLQRLRGTKPEEFNKLKAQYGDDAQRFGLPANVALQWQEFVTQLSRAGQGIEQTFIKGLLPLAGPLTTLSKAVENLVQATLKSDTLKQGIDSMSSALERFAGYVGTPDFQHNVEDFVTGVGNLAQATVGALRFFGFIPSGGRAPSQSEITRAEADIAYGIGGGGSVNNPGNLRPPGAASGFQSFATPEAGLRAMADQILRYERRDKLDTIEKIVSKYAPASENDTQAYIRDVAKRSGIAPDQRLNPNDAGELAKLLAAMVAHEQRGGRYEQYKDAKVVVQVIKPVGADVDLSVNGLKQ